MLAVASREEAKVVQRKEGNANSGKDIKTHRLGIGFR